MSSDFVSLKDLIRNRRLELGLSQANLAAAIGKRNAEYIATIEAGHESVSLNRAAAFAAALQLDRLDFYKLVQFELFPGFYAIMFGPERPSPPKRLDQEQ